MRARFLYWYHNKLVADSIPCEHRHPYWQVEVLIAGLLRIGPTRELRVFKAPSIVLISPKTLHTVQKNSGEGEAFSFKLQINGLKQNATGTFSIPDDYFCRWLHGAITDLILNEKQEDEPFTNKIHVLEHLATALFDHIGDCSSETHQVEPELFSRLRELVMTCGREANIDTVAEHLNCSAAHLKYTFRRTSQEHPELNAGSSVKNFMDLVCVELIEKYLRYSKMPVGKIAEAAGFPDIYKLSRFYRRMRNMTPSDFRKKLP